MLTKKITIINKLGLHARAAAKLVAITDKFSCDIQLYYDNQQANAKSIIDVMTLAVTQGLEIEIIIDGPEADKAMQEIVELINNRFGEKE